MSAPTRIPSRDAGPRAVAARGELEDFIDRLRTAPTELGGSRAVDWRDAPWPVTVVSGGPRTALARPSDGVDPRLAELLAGAFAISDIRVPLDGRLPATPQNPARHAPAQTVLMRRPIPSGGAMYPTEAYVVRPGRSQPTAVTLYDPYRHELVGIGERGDPSALAAVLVDGDGAVPACAMALTHRYWKNYYKYGEFSYRLGTVDVGVALGRCIRLGRRLFGAVSVRLDFADAAVDAGIGLRPDDEACYAIVRLGTDAVEPSHDEPTEPPPSRPLTILERSRHVSMSTRFQRAAAAARGPRRSVADDSPRDADGVVPLPDPVPAFDERAAIVARTSNGDAFTGRPVDPALLATVLRAAWAALHGAYDVSGDLVPWPRLSIYCAAQHVRGVPPGWYRYDGERHVLRVPSGAVAEKPDARLSRALRMATIDVERAAFTVHPVGAAHLVEGDDNVRAYRAQQLLVGVLVEAVTTAAAAVGLGSHPFLGIDAVTLDGGYGFDGESIARSERQGVLAQVCVGDARPRGELHLSTFGDPDGSRSTRTES